MSKEEIIDYLKENLNIEAELIPHDTGYCKPDSYSVKVTLKLGTEIISTSETDSL